MKIGDLVELKNSVLREEFGASKPKKKRWLGVILHKHQNAIKVHWFDPAGSNDVPSTSQYVLKVRVVSEL